MARQPVTIEFTGLENVQEILNKLPAQYAKKPIQAAFRKAAKPFIQVLKTSAPNDTGETAKAIGIKAGKGASITVGFRTGSGYMPAWFKAYWRNYGTLANRDTAHAFIQKRKAKTANRKGGVIPLRFVEKAWEQTKGQTEEIVQKELVTQTEKFLQKYAVK